VNIIHCVQKKVSPLKILQYHEENFTELNIILLKDSHMNFKQRCERDGVGAAVTKSASADYYW